MSGPHLAIVWAVGLGCTTAARLAREWRISNGEAASRLRTACAIGHITRITRGVYASPCLRRHQ